MSNKIEHNWIKFTNSTLWEKCSNCKIERTITRNKLLETYYIYYNPTEKYPTQELNNLSCEEVIIKNIIE